MNLVDLNLLVYAWNAGDPHHQAAKEWLSGQFSQVSGVALPWPVLLGFIRLTTNKKIFTGAVPVETAWAQVDEWLALPNVWIPEPADRHREILAELIPQAGKPELIPDAHLAALAIEYGLVLKTTDRDFARFSGLRWENPLDH